MRSFPWDSMTVGIGDDGFPIYDRAYDAQDLRDVYKAHFTNGVVKGEGQEWRVRVDPDGEPMSVSVGTGVANIQGSTTFGEAEQMLSISPAEANDRIDSIVIRFDKTMEVRDDFLAVVKGTASTKPVHPQLTRTDDIYELAIADVRVHANTTAITNENITSTVEDTGRCGFSGATTPVETITGILPVTKGGTGNANGTVAKLTTARTIRTNLGSTGTASFDGSANISPGVTGTLPVANGGTGVTTSASIGLKSYPVGAVYISYVNTSPASLFGGTWSQMTGVLRMAKDVSTGGSDTHTHGLSSGYARVSNSGSYAVYKFKEQSGVNWTANYGVLGTNNVNKSFTMSGSADLAGNTGSASTLPAYQDLYAWRRTA